MFMQEQGSKPEHGEPDAQGFPPQSLKALQRFLPSQPPPQSGLVHRRQLHRRTNHRRPPIQPGWGQRIHHDGHQRAELRRDERCGPRGLD